MGEFGAWVDGAMGVVGLQTLVNDDEFFLFTREAFEGPSVFMMHEQFFLYTTTVSGTQIIQSNTEATSDL